MPRARNESLAYEVSARGTALHPGPPDRSGCLSRRIRPRGAGTRHCQLLPHPSAATHLGHCLTLTPSRFTGTSTGHAQKRQPRTPLPPRTRGAFSPRRLGMDRLLPMVAEERTGHRGASPGGSRMGPVRLSESPGHHTLGYPRSRRSGRVRRCGSGPSRRRLDETRPRVHRARRHQPVHQDLVRPAATRRLIRLYLTAHINRSRSSFAVLSPSIPRHDDKSDASSRLRELRSRRVITRLELRRTVDTFRGVGGGVVESHTAGGEGPTGPEAPKAKRFRGHGLGMRRHHQRGHLPGRPVGMAGWYRL